MSPPMRSRDCLPPADMWPTLLRAGLDVACTQPLNLAASLLDRHVVEGAGERTAIFAAGERVTFADLQRRTNRIGHALRAAGVEAGDRVVMRFLNNGQFVATWLAVQKIGAVGVSTMPMLRARELAYVVNDSEARVAVCQHELLEERAKARVALDHPVTIVPARASDGRAASDEPRDPA